MQRWVANIVLALAVGLGSDGASAAGEGRYAVVDLGEGAALAINELGHVVGVDEAGAFLWSAERGFLRLPPLRGDAGAIAHDVNDRDVAVGESDGKQTTAVRWSNGRVESLGRLPGDDHSAALGIDAAGRIVGESHEGVERAFLWTSADGMTDLGTLPGGRSSRAEDVSDAGTVVGAGDSSMGERGFRWTPERGMEKLPALRVPGTSHAVAENDAGVAVGWSFRQPELGIDRAVRWSPSGDIRNLGVLSGDERSNAEDVNDRGEIVGWSGRGYPIALVSHAFLWTRDGGMVDLNTRVRCDCRLRTATGVNTRGEIVGTMLVAGRRHAFLLRPR
jgi:probable HAF family extracellular repeat protein